MRPAGFFATTDEAFTTSCWYLYGGIPLTALLLVADILQPLVTAMMIAGMAYGYWRMEAAAGTFLASHFENAVFCTAAAIGIHSAGVVILPVLKGTPREAFLLLVSAALIWGLNRLAQGAFLLSRKLPAVISAIPRRRGGWLR